VPLCRKAIWLAESSPQTFVLLVYSDQWLVADAIFAVEAQLRDVDRHAKPCDAERERECVQTLESDR